MGFRRRKPRRVIANADPELRAAYKKLRKIARKDDMDIWFEDECHFQQHGSRCSMWVHPEDIDPIVLHAPTRKHVGAFGAVSLEGKFMFQPLQQFNAETFLCFLKKLICHRRKKP